MKSYPHNPRRISQKRAKRLEADLKRFGDLGGIVHDLNTDQLVGGHQRLRVLFGERGDVFQVKDADIEIVQRMDAPDKQGTIAHGFILWQGFRYAYRQVRWDEETFKEANIKTNLDGGTWDWDIASGIDGLMEYGFDEEFLADLNTDAVAVREILGAELAFGNTSTDRNGQGVNSTWDQVKNAETQKVIIGTIETHLPQTVIDMLVSYLDNQFRTHDTPIFETLEAVIIAGLNSLEDSDS